MKRLRTGIAIPLAIIVGCGMTPLLSGCSVESLVNNAVEGATGGDVSLGGKLPADWPSEVPVVDGEILFGVGATSEGEKGWVVTIKTKSGDALGDAQSQLEDAGFELDTTASANQGLGLIAMKNDSYGVVVAGSDDGVIYTVTPIPPTATPTPIS